MKRVILFAIALPFALYALVAKGQDVVFDVPKITEAALALPIQSCELNGDSKGWTTPDGKPLTLPVYRCTARDNFASAVFTQIPDGSREFPKEFVELCLFTNHTRSCEVVPIDRPATRTADLKKYGVVEREFNEQKCAITDMVGEGGRQGQICDPYSEKK